MPAYKSEKRQKELARLKKREEKRLAKLEKKKLKNGQAETVEGQKQAPEDLGAAGGGDAPSEEQSDQR